MKKLLLIVLLGIITPNLFSQEAPTAETISSSIAQGIESLNIEPEDIFKIENRSVGAIPIRIYYPSSEQHQSIIYNIHGGAFVAGDLDTHENISRKIANATNSVVISLDYRKPLEFPFPHSLDDVYTVYKWILDNRVELMGSEAPLWIISDSSGSILASALQVKLSQLKEESQIEKAVYINPAFDLRSPGPYTLVINWYLDGANPENPLVSPIASSDFSIFCPSLIVVNEKDYLKKQGIDFGKKLDEKDIENEIFTVPEEDHFGVLWAGAHPKINNAFESVIVFLKK